MSNIIVSSSDSLMGVRVYCGLYGGKYGTVCEIGASSNSLLIGSKGLTQSGRRVVVVWEDLRMSDTLENQLTQAPWRMMDNEPVTSDEVCARLLIQAREKQASDREAAKTAREAQEEENARRVSLLEQKRPAWAKAAMVAIYQINTSDSQTDYFASSTERMMVIAWSKHQRNLFPEMRKAAANIDETAHLAGEQSVEHRENYSMGAGTFLSHHHNSHATGWLIRKLDLSHGMPAAEYRVPEAVKPKQSLG